MLLCKLYLKIIFHFIMKIFKFGGASVKDAQGVRNVAKIIDLFQNDGLCIVVSAMGKTTNALEELVHSHFKGLDDHEGIIKRIQEYHLSILEELFPSKEHLVYEELAHVFQQLRLIGMSKPDPDYNLTYDRIVSYGEILSTKIIAYYLNDLGLDTTYLDARKVIKTDQNYRFARINWNFTQILLNQAVKNKKGRYIIQGFIGSDDNYNATTLGREGSDYTASVCAYVLDAEEVVIWKDVPGVLNGDPKVFENTELIHLLNYREAIELAYYGASVIHPKTIQPLQQKGIPLRVKSFLNPQNSGTSIQSLEGNMEPQLPCFILKTNQVLIRIQTRDLAFIVEEHLSKIYSIFHRYGVRVNMTQSSAISSSFCINHDVVNLPLILEALQADFEVEYAENKSLYTIRHYTEESKNGLLQNKELLMQQITHDTYQMVCDA